MNESSSFLRRPQKFGAIFLKVLTLLSKVKTLRKIAPNFCGLLRKAELYKMCSLYSCVHCAYVCVWMAHLDQNDDLNRANNERFCRDQKNLAYSTAEVWWWSSLRNSKVSERKEKIKSCHQGLKNWKQSVSSASARTGSDWIEKPGIPISCVL